MNQKYVFFHSFPDNSEKMSNSKVRRIIGAVLPVGVQKLNSREVHWRFQSYFSSKSLNSEQTSNIELGELASELASSTPRSSSF
jgi:hypothetical protein